MYAIMYSFVIVSSYSFIEAPYSRVFNTFMRNDKPVNTAALRTFVHLQIKHSMEKKMLSKRTNRKIKAQLEIELKLSPGQSCMERLSCLLVTAFLLFWQLFIISCVFLITSCTLTIILDAAGIML